MHDVAKANTRINVTNLIFLMFRPQTITENYVFMSPTNVLRLFRGQTMPEDYLGPVQLIEKSRSVKAAPTLVLKRYTVVEGAVVLSSSQVTESASPVSA